MQEAAAIPRQSFFLLRDIFACKEGRAFEVLKKIPAK